MLKIIRSMSGAEAQDMDPWGWLYPDVREIQKSKWVFPIWKIMRSLQGANARLARLRKTKNKGFW